MTFYELVFIIRQDVSSTDVDKIINDFAALASEGESEVVKREYWGLLPFAYEIKGSKKGHYVLFGLKSTPEIIQEVRRKMKLSESIIRYLTKVVDSISQTPSPILRSNSNSEEAVDVTN